LSLLTTSPPNDISKLIRSFYIPITLLFAVVKIDLKEQQEYCPTSEHHYLEEANSNATESYVVEEKSWVLYAFVFQYLIILKLIVGPLLFSIFAATASKVAHMPWKHSSLTSFVILVGVRNRKHLEVPALPLE